MDEQYDLACLRERSNLTRQIFFPEVDSNSIARDVVFFSSNRILGVIRRDSTRSERDRQDYEQRPRPQSGIPCGSHVHPPENDRNYGL